MASYGMSGPATTEVVHLLSHSPPGTNGHKNEVIGSDNGFTRRPHQSQKFIDDRRDIPATSTYDNAAFELESAESAAKPNNNEMGANTWHGDDALVYANIAEIARRRELDDIDRRPYPPYPDASAQPLRTIANGWQEYRTMGGRSYYFHPETGICQWKPPRSTAGYKFKHDEAAEDSVFSPQNNDCLASTSSSKEFFAEIPLHHELMNKFRTSSSINDRHHPALQEFGADKSGISFTPNKGIMSHSLDSGIRNNDPASHLHQQQQQQQPEATHSNSNSTHYDIPAMTTQSRETAIRHGFLERCKLAEHGVKLKRRDWSSSYAYLFIGHLLFYKDQKSAEKTGKHYPPPLDVCDLRNAIVTYTDNEKQKDKRRKHVLSLVLISNTEYLLSCETEEMNSWFHALRQAITSIPINKLPSSTIISDYCGSLSRSSLRHKRDSGPFASKTNFHSSIKSRLKSASTSKDDRLSIVEGSPVEHSPPTKESIIEKLLRFFRSRPSMESLRERGIYKPEPVFGSTLSEICNREKTLVPKFITEVTRLIEQKGLDSDGLYRVNGNLSAVQKIRCQIDQDSYDAMRHEEDIHVLTGALKLFLRELAEPIFPVPMHKDFMSAMRESGAKRLRTIDDLLIRLPSINKETLRILIQHLNRVANNSGKNRMQIHNLAIIFGPSLFCSEERPSHLRKSSQDKAKGTRRKSSDKRIQEDLIQSEPTQNLAYRMIVYGQIVEYILNETDRLFIFKVSMQQ